VSHANSDTEVISKAIASRLTEAVGDVTQALACVNSAHVTFTELVAGWLSDADPAETSAGDDALDRLAQAAAGLRDVARIIENRQLREQAATPEDQP
jgi:hypothetical protein